MTTATPSNTSTAASASTPLDITTPEQLFARLVQVQAAIKEQETIRAVLLDLLDAMHSLGELADYEDEDGAFVIDDIRACPVTRTTWTYPAAVKTQIKALQQQAQVEGVATAATSRHYRITSL
jgi:hypothetical protein